MTGLGTREVTFVVRGWWVRLCWGLTFKPKRFRKHKGHGYTLLAVRLWGPPLDSRLALAQWRRAKVGDSWSYSRSRPKVVAGG